MDELQYQPGYPVATADEDDFEEAGNEPGPESADYWRKKAEEADRLFKQTVQEAQRKIGEQGESISQLNQTLQALVINQQRAQVAPTQQQPAAGSDWVSYYNQLSQGGTQNGQQQTSTQGLTPEQIAALADQRAQQQISQTIQALQQQDQKAAQLYQRFAAEKPELVPYQDVVARFYGTSDPRKPMEQRYAEAIAQTEAMINSGRLPKNPPRRAATPGFGGSPSGGQMNPYAAPPAIGQKPPSDEDMAKSLTAWTNERRNRLANKKELVPYELPKEWR